MNNNYEELDMLHEQAKLLSGGNRFAYLAIMIAELIISGLVLAWFKVKEFVKNLF